MKELAGMGRWASILAPLNCPALNRAVITLSSLFDARTTGYRGSPRDKGSRHLEATCWLVGTGPAEGMSGTEFFYCPGHRNKDAANGHSQEGRRAPKGHLSLFPLPTVTFWPSHWPNPTGDRVWVTWPSVPALGPQTKEAKL